MKVLILRTFTVEKIWESDKTICSYEGEQLTKQILVWEPDYLNLKYNDIKYAIGIYMDKYFTYAPFGGNGKIKFTENENNISIIKLRPYNNNQFIFYNTQDIQNGTSIPEHLEDLKSIQIQYEFERKLWPKGDRVKMKNIDEQLLTMKSKIVGNKPVLYKPLSFTLPELQVTNLLQESFKEAK